jgi:hypothetical protein
VGEHLEGAGDRHEADEGGLGGVHRGAVHQLVHSGLGGRRVQDGARGRD